MVDDKRPRLYTNIEAPYGHIELTVQGAEGEDASDLEDVFTSRLQEAVKAQRGLAGEEEPNGGFE